MPWMPISFEGLLHLVELERLDDRFDLLHGSPPRSMNRSNGRTKSAATSQFLPPAAENPRRFRVIPRNVAEQAMASGLSRW